jgi:hypothetical protein
MYGSLTGQDLAAIHGDTAFSATAFSLTGGREDDLFLLQEPEKVRSLRSPDFPGLIAPADGDSMHAHTSVSRLARRLGHFSRGPYWQFT